MRPEASRQAEGCGRDPSDWQSVGEKGCVGPGWGERGRQGWGEFGSFLPLHFSPQSSFCHLTPVFALVCFFHLPGKMSHPQGQRFCSFCSLICLWHLGNCLVHCGCSSKYFLVNEQADWTGWRTREKSEQRCPCFQHGQHGSWSWLLRGRTRLGTGREGMRHPEGRRGCGLLSREGFGQGQ